MAKTVKRVISGARVNYDPRTTAEANASRDPRNYRTEQKALRTKRYFERKRQEQQQKQKAA